MSIRLLALCVIGILLGSSAWAKDKPQVTLPGLLAKSDTVYYYPSLAGLKDLAVDIQVDTFAKIPVAKDAHITYYFAGEARQRVQVTDIPEAESQFRDGVVNMVMPWSQYIVPLPSGSTFTGMTLRMEKVSAQFLGVTDTAFYQIMGTAKDKTDPVKEYRVLMNKDGLIYQIEPTLADGSNFIASVENVQSESGKWHVATLTTRYVASGKVRWKVEHVEYATVDGFIVPVSYTVKYRNEFNRPVDSGANDLVVTFSNYRINTGAADTAVTAMEATEKANPTPPPTVPAPATAP